MTYPRSLYVGILGLSVAALVLASSFGEGPEIPLAYLLASGLGAVAFYQGEERVTPGPIVANVGIALVVGSLLALLTVAGLFIGLLGVPWDIALWQGGLRIWVDVLGVGFVFTTAFFVIGSVASLT